MAADPLPSWNEGAAKKAILEFVAKVTKPGGPEFVPVAERIATFDNDGTLWCEKPMYVQVVYAMDQVKAQAAQHPEWRDKQPYKDLIAGDLRAAMKLSEKEVMSVLMDVHAGMTTEQYEKNIKDWLATARHPRFKRPYPELTYQPMLELLAFLRANGFQTFIVSGGGIDFMRSYAEKAYGIPPQQIVGSSMKTKFEFRDDKPIILRLPALDFIDDGPGKPEGIQRFIGRRPVMAFGNSDGDLQMLQWTTAGAGPRFGLIVHHTDPVREYAYDRDSDVGRLVKALDQAPKNGWTVVSMKDDWKVIFPFELTGSKDRFPDGTLKTRAGDLQFRNGYPARETAEKLYDELDFQRACQAYLWSLPLVSFAEWQKAHERIFGAGDGDLVIYPDYQSKLGILTPNLTTPYITGFADLARTGPLVIEAPAGSASGGIGDFWQRPITDFGQTGPDKGKGGKYLLLGPGQSEPKAEGYRVARSSTNNVILGFRVLATDLAESKKLLQGFRIYSFAQSADPPATKRLGTGGKSWSATPPRGLSYWRALHDILEREPVQERDRLIMATLRPLGIEKGKPFRPTTRQQNLLTEGALVGEAMARANDYSRRFEGGQVWPGARWEIAMFLDPSQRQEHFDQLDERAAWFYEAVTAAKAMVTKTPGVGQVYLAAYQDKDGDWLDGGRAYILRVPPNVPAKQFWSATLYDNDTRRLLENPSRKADLSSRQNLVRNTDGSTDLYFGPTPTSGKEINWVQTIPGQGWFTYFRLFGPTESYHDRSWKLPDIEKAN
jgi:hypothetical protein